MSRGAAGNPKEGSRPPRRTHIYPRGTGLGGPAGPKGAGEGRAIGPSPGGIEPVRGGKSWEKKEKREPGPERTAGPRHPSSPASATTPTTRGPKARVSSRAAAAAAPTDTGTGEPTSEGGGEHSDIAKGEPRMLGRGEGGGAFLEPRRRTKFQPGSATGTADHEGRHRPPGANFRRAETDQKQLVWEHTYNLGISFYDH